MNTLFVILALIAAISKAIMDLIAKGKWRGWWNKADSWRNKWKQCKSLNECSSKFLCVDGVCMNPKGRIKERFPGSSTVFVWLTDGWHLFQTIFLISFTGAILTFDSGFGLWENILILVVGFGMLFQIFYWSIDGIFE